MVTSRHILTSVCVSALMIGAPAFSDAESTKILEEYFSIFDSTDAVLSVGNKDDAARSTQWSDVKIMIPDVGEMSMPWIKVSKKLLGGSEMTVAETINFSSVGNEALEYPPLSVDMVNKGLSISISGDEAAREFVTAFDEITVRTKEEGPFNINLSISGGAGSQVYNRGDVSNTSGTFSYDEVKADYNFEIEGQRSVSSSVSNGMKGDFLIPLYDDLTSENLQQNFDFGRDAYLNYSTTSGSGTSQVPTPLGPVELIMNFGATDAKIGLIDSVMSMVGTGVNAKYTVSIAAMGLPPMDISLDEVVMDMQFPLNNTEAAKATKIKMGLFGLEVADQLWNMIDSGQVLPRDKADLDINVSGDVIWTKQIKDIDPEQMTDGLPPVRFENASIDALNLKVAGAELVTKGSVTLDNNAFPPVPDGSVQVSLKGAQTLMGKLSEMGLLPAQNAIAAQGMMAVFFKSGTDGDDHMTSEVVFTKDGHISANGIPVK